ncbi:MAG TPA: Arm DNA-binding domain-containing protein [Thermohalobaculum sp.]|nr:Arm DNA-binding domain-containing protein [Thermohalobaculum sp.]
MPPRATELTPTQIKRLKHPGGNRPVKVAVGGVSGLHIQIQPSGAKSWVLRTRFNTSPSVLFRVVEAFKPTVLVDEGDTFLKDNDDLRGILNGGHDRLSAFVWRSVGDDHEPRQFRVWAPKAIDMIGRLHDTFEDRAIVVPLSRLESGRWCPVWMAPALQARIDHFGIPRSGTVLCPAC